MRALWDYGPAHFWTTPTQRTENRSGRKSKIETRIQVDENREYKWTKIENTSGRKSKREYKWMKIENTSGRKSKREYKWMKIENRIENRKYNSMKIENGVENRKYNSMKSALLGHRNIHLKLIFAFAAQSSLSEVRNDNVRNAVRTRGTCAVPTRYGSAYIHKPVRYSCTVTTVPCHKTCTNHDITVYYV